MMRWLLRRMACPGVSSAFHCTALACMVTGAVMVLTTSDMGALAPLVISAGLYLAFFGLMSELLFGLRRGAAMLAARALARQ